MSEKRFYKLNSRFVDIEEAVIYDNFEQKALNIEQSVELLNILHKENEKKDRILKGQDAEISRLYNLSMAMSGILREEFGVYDVFDRTKDKKTN